MSIEELAFKDRKILANLNAIDLLDIIEFLQEDRNQWINQFTKTHNEGVEIQKENQELKEALEAKSYCKYANKCDEFDDCSKEEYEIMAIENIKLSIENQELKSQLSGTTHCFDEEEHRVLKKQLEEINKFVCKCGFANIEQVMLNYCGLLTQQKEFIKYLENEIKEIEKTIELLSDTGSCRIPNLQYKKHILEETLQKYKEITQTKNNNSV
jgi:hypothetical protein